MFNHSEDERKIEDTVAVYLSQYPAQMSDHNHTQITYRQSKRRKRFNSELSWI